MAEEYGDIKVMGGLEVVGVTTLSTIHITASASLPDNSTAVTQLPTTNSTKIATTAYVDTGLDTKVKSDGTVNPTNLLSNGNFENWSAGASAAPDGWTLIQDGSSSVAREGTIVYSGSYSAKIISNGGTYCYLKQDFSATKGLAYWQGRTVTVSARIRTSTANAVSLSVVDNVNNPSSSFCPGDGAYHLITLTCTIASNASAFYVRILDSGVNATIYTDDIMCVEGSSAFAFADKPAIDPGIAIGGTGSAGAGKQYVVIRVGGVNYKVLHDGTI